MRIFYGHHGLRITYRFNGRPSFWTGRAASVLARYNRIKDDPRVTELRMTHQGKPVDPAKLVVHHDHTN